MQRVQAANPAPELARTCRGQAPRYIYRLPGCRQPALRLPGTWFCGWVKLGGRESQARGQVVVGRREGGGRGVVPCGGGAVQQLLCFPIFSSINCIHCTHIFHSTDSVNHDRIRRVNPGENLGEKWREKMAGNLGEFHGCNALKWYTGKLR
jgi:hypothetical protein